MLQPRTTFLSGLLALASILLAAPLSAQRGPAAVGVETVEMRPLAETVPVFAEVVAARDGEVASRVSGSISAVEVFEGDTVEQGEPLVRIDTELLSILLRRAEAEVAVSEAALSVVRARVDTARTAFERVEGLRQSAAFSEGRFDDAQGTLLEAEAGIPEAEARLAVAQAARAEAAYRLERATILAPFAGTVVEVMVNPGEFIQTGAPVLRLLDTDALEVEASVPARYVELMEAGLAVMGRAETGGEFELTVRALLPIEAAATRTRPVRFTAPALSEGRTTAVGQSVTVLIPVDAPRDLLTVPKDALVQARGGWTVFVVEDGMAQPRTVTVGLAVGDRFEVISGLAEGDVVVVRGNERLRPGQAVAAGGGRPGGPPGGGEGAPGGPPAAPGGEARGDAEDAPSETAEAQGQ